jgi:hypothetical protein
MRHLGSTLVPEFPHHLEALVPGGVASPSMAQQLAQA